MKILMAGAPGAGKGTQGSRREHGTGLDVVVHLVVPSEVLRSRLLDRGRQDDTAEVVAHRLEVYEQQTAPLLGTYADEGRLVMVDGTGTIDEVSERIVRDLQVWRLRRTLAV